MKIIRLKNIPREKKEGYSIKRLLTEKISNKPDSIGFYETTVPVRSKCAQHIHERLYEFIYFLTKGKMRIDNKYYKLDPGDIVILHPGDKHEFIADEDEVRIIAIKLPNIINDKVVC